MAKFQGAISREEIKCLVERLELCDSGCFDDIFVSVNVNQDGALDYYEMVEYLRKLGQDGMLEEVCEEGSQGVANQEEDRKAEQTSSKSQCSHES